MIQLYLLIISFDVKDNFNLDFSPNRTNMIDNDTTTNNDINNNNDVINEICFFKGHQNPWRLNLYMLYVD